MTCFRIVWSVSTKNNIVTCAEANNEIVRLDCPVFLTWHVNKNVLDYMQTRRNHGQSCVPRIMSFAERLARDFRLSLKSGCRHIRRRWHLRLTCLVADLPQTSACPFDWLRCHRVCQTSCCLNTTCLMCLNRTWTGQAVRKGCPSLDLYGRV